VASPAALFDPWIDTSGFRESCCGNRGTRSTAGSRTADSSAIPDGCFFFHSAHSEPQCCFTLNHENVFSISMPSPS